LGAVVVLKILSVKKLVSAGKVQYFLTKINPPIATQQGNQSKFASCSGILHPSHPSPGIKVPGDG
jgi:hypothetical protein